MTTLLPLLGLTLLGSVLALVGGLAFVFLQKSARWLVLGSVPFAAGVLLTVSLVGLIPEAMHLGGESMLYWVLGTFLTAYLFEQFFFSLHHHDEDDCHEHAHDHVTRAVPLVVIGDTIHNFIDGVAIAASYLVNPGLGLVTAVSTFLHEVPHEIGDFGLLLKAGWTSRKVILVNILSSLASFVGVGFVLALPQVSEYLGVLMAIAAGLFLFLGASDFLPHIHQKQSAWKKVLPLLLGVGLMLGAMMAIPHSHETGEADAHGHAAEEEHAEEEPHADEDDHIEEDPH